jgi:hypothetical protein
MYYKGFIIEIKYINTLIKILYYKGFIIEIKYKYIN